MPRCGNEVTRVGVPYFPQKIHPAKIETHVFEPARVVFDTKAALKVLHLVSCN